MADRERKPLVFLSHSKRDVAFVKKVQGDFALALIDTWLDERDIPHGQSWLDAIFGDGIATCDCVLVYLTENAVESKIVKDEINASLIRRLKDGRVGFLPYVSDAAIRNRLRGDLQSLQTPEWNEQNYAQLLPRVVAEVWRSFHQRSQLQAIAEERNKRLEAELELQRLQSASTGIFSTTEEADFQYIWGRLEKWVPVCVTESPPKGAPHSPRVVRGQICLRSVLSFLSQARELSHGADAISEAVKSPLVAELGLTYERSGISLDSHAEYGLARDLTLFGLLERHEPTRHSDEDRLWGSSITTPASLRYTPKMDRLNYWVDYKGFLPKGIEWKPETAQEPPTK